MLIDSVNVDRAFTTRIPFAVLIALGIKEYENRRMMPNPPSGICAITCSKNSDEKEYESFLKWSDTAFTAGVRKLIPEWNEVESWRGKIIGVCKYDASFETPEFPFWNEGYKCWWHLTKPVIFNDPIPCKGSTGMWRL